MAAYLLPMLIDAEVPVPLGVGMPVLLAVGMPVSLDVGIREADGKDGGGMEWGREEVVSWRALVLSAGVVVAGCACEFLCP